MHRIKYEPFIMFHMYLQTDVNWNASKDYRNEIANVTQIYKTVTLIGLNISINEENLGRT